MVRWTLYVLIGAVVLSALLGIGALLGFFDFGAGTVEWVLTRLFMTALCVVGACTLSMASTEGWDRPGGRLYAVLCVITSNLGFLLLAIGLWAEFVNPSLGRAYLSLMIVGPACAHGSLVMRAPLADRYAWIRRPTLALAGILAGLLLYKVWRPLPLLDLWRPIGFLSILVAASTIQVSAFRRMSMVASTSRREDPPAPGRCPCCGALLQAAEVDRSLEALADAGAADPPATDGGSAGDEPRGVDRSK